MGRRFRDEAPQQVRPGEVTVATLPGGREYRIEPDDDGSARLVATIRTGDAAAKADIQQVRREITMRVTR